MTTFAAQGTNVAILGAGTVGSALLARLSDLPSVTVSGVLVRDTGKPRQLAVPPELVTDDPRQAVSGADIVVELMGGTGLARELMLEALEQGKPVVTGNKAALAEHWEDFAPFMERGLLYFEAAVMAGTPVIAPLVNVLRGSEPLQLEAILNGTCSYMIGRLEAGLEFGEALEEAQELGYAEADPTLDIGGIDAAHKLSIMARLAFDPELSWQQVSAATSGITELTPGIVKEAMEDGGRVALLASIRPEAGSWQAGVRPVYLPASHSLAQLGQGLNGYVFTGRHSGVVFSSGPGAGGDSTASAVLADLLQVLSGRPGPAPLRTARPVPVDWQPDELGELKRQ